MVRGVFQEFAHCVLAGDVATARKMLRLSQKLKVNINFRNMVCAIPFC